MAKKKHTKRPATRRRGRVSGLGGANMNQLLGLAVGSVASPFIDGLLEKAKITDKKFKAGAKVALSVFLLPKVTKNPMAKAVGDGIVAFSALQLASDFGLYKNGTGIGDAGDEVYVDLSALNGIDDTITGMEDGDYVGEYVSTITGIEDEE